MAYIQEVPSDDQVLAALEQLGGRADALALCERLMAEGHPELQSQLAIQRTAERGKLMVERDWTLSLIPVQVAA
jgi:hypothetical protein